jgi:hypothetical protein
MLDVVEDQSQDFALSPSIKSANKRGIAIPDIVIESDETLPPATPPPYSKPPPMHFCNSKTLAYLGGKCKLREQAIALGKASGRSKNPILGNWQLEEDDLLRKAVAILYDGSFTHHRRVPWSIICLAVPGRTSKQCRERFVEHLDTSLDLTALDGDEACFVFYLFGKHGRQWSKVCSDLNQWRFDRGIETVRSCNFTKNFITSKKHIFETNSNEAVCEDSSLPPLPESRAIEGIEFGELADVMPHDDDDANTDNACNTFMQDVVMDPLQQLLPHGMWPEPTDTTSISNVTGDSDTSVTTVCTQRKGGYLDMVNTPPRALCTQRKIRVKLSQGPETPCRSLFESINNMINNPSVVGLCVSAEDDANRQAEIHERQLRASVRLKAVQDSAKVWASNMPKA